MEQRDLIIVGGGPAGLTAAIYGRRAGLSTLVIEKGVFGGAIAVTDEIENWPGVKHATGPELGDMFKEHADVLNTEFLDAEVKSIREDGASKIVTTDKGDYQAKALIVATGSSFRKLGCPGEAEFTGRGVSYCATCDGAFFEDLEVAVIGGGNTAVEEACYLTQFASKVYIVHRRDKFRADQIAVDRALANPKIEPVWDSVVEEIAGDDMVEKVVVKNVKTGGLSDIPVSGVFMFVGNTPNADLIKDMVDVEKGDWIKTDAKMATSLPGLFAAGDMRSKSLRQVVTAASDGAIAAMSSYEYIAEHF
ncbi:MAG: thioredoxin-disulfide reductase [Dethiosulfovibrio peptidovorans]|nr:MAG: thioredoxin-disulfide reductase [Dethiosulfovibrio peptidovorans]